MKRRNKTEKKQQTRTVETRDLVQVQGGYSYYTKATVYLPGFGDYGDRSGG